ncbi:MAG: hypothetical protein WAO35_25300 [Terriglobia bacterium]
MVTTGNSEEQGGQELSKERETEELVDGGFVRNLDEYSFRVRHREHTARRLAYALVGILGGSFAFHYIATMVLEFNGKSNAVENLNRVFNAWLPVIASLVGGAVTYYFTRGKNE